MVIVLNPYGLGLIHTTLHQVYMILLVLVVTCDKGVCSYYNYVITSSVDIGRIRQYWTKENGDNGMLSFNMDAIRGDKGTRPKRRVPCGSLATHV